MTGLLVAACTASAPADTTTSTSSVPNSTTTAATSTTSSTTTTEPLSGPGYGGIAIIGDDQYPPTLNPLAEQGDHFIVSLIAQAWMAGVWDIDGTTLEMIPEVVTELPTVSNGGVEVNNDGTMTVRYTVVDTAQWSDGTPITGADLEFTVRANLDREASARFETPYTDADIVAMAAEGKTFEMTLARPSLAHEGLFRHIYPAHALDETDVTALDVDDSWPSGGAFIIADRDPGRSITLVRNGAYWKTDPATGLQLPYLDGVEFHIIPETEELVRGFRARELDVINPSPFYGTAVDPLMALEDAGAEIIVRQGTIWEHLNFQFGPGRTTLSPDTCNDDLRFRRAVMLAVDTSAIAESAIRQPTPLSSYVDAYSPTLSTGAWLRYPHDPEAARVLYEDVVEDRGTPCTAVFSSTSNGDLRITVANALVPMFEEAGIPLELELMDSQVFFGDVLDDGTWDIGMWAWVGSPGLLNLINALDLFDPSAPPPDGSNYYRWGTKDSSVTDEHTERFAQIVEELDRTVDDAEIVALLAEAEGILADQAVILPLFSRLTVGAVWADEIGGYVHNPSQAGHTWNIEFWYRTDRE